MPGLRLWRKIEAKGEPQYSRNKHTAVVVSSKLLIFGGYSLQQRQFYNDITAFDFETREWQELEVCGQVPSKRRAHSCVVLGDGMLVLFGGYNGDYCLNDVHTFDLETKQWRKRECTGDIPPHRGGHTAVAWKEDRMVVHGGWDVGNVYYDCTYVLHTAEWRWEKLRISSSYRPVGRVGHTSVLHDENNLYVFGGYGTDGYWDDLNLLNLTTGQWSIVEVEGDIRPCQRTFSTMEIVGNCILLFGGSNHDVEMNDVMLFNTETRTWDAVDCPGDVPDGRFAHVSCMYNHKVYLHGGIVRGSGELSGMYELTLEDFTCNGTLKNLLTAWIVNAGLQYHNYAYCLPAGVVATLDSYRDETLEMQEMEKVALDEKAAVEIVLPGVEDREMDVDEEPQDDAAFTGEEGYYDLDCESNPEIWDIAVEDIMHHMLDANLCTPATLPSATPRATSPIPECSSSSALGCMSASSSTSHLDAPGLIGQPALPMSTAVDCFQSFKIDSHDEFAYVCETEDVDMGTEASWLENDQPHSFFSDSPWLADMDKGHSGTPSPLSATFLPSFCPNGARPIAEATAIDSILSSSSLSFGLPSGPWSGRCLQPLCPPTPPIDAPFDCFPPSASIAAP